jgi:tRNA pseudouridine38-40 synthase
MEQGAHLLLGTHDFSSFCNERALWTRSTVCTLEEIQILPLETQRLRIAFCGDHFLYKMVRNLAGTLAYIGCGKLHPEYLPAILAAHARPLAGMTAPACGLTLDTVYS